MRVVIAPDAFKGSATAGAVASTLGEGWLSVRAGDEILLRPMADGGEGTIDALAAAHPSARHVPVAVMGPDDQPISVKFLLLEDGTAVVELASTSGIGLTDLRRPLQTHTRGFGQAITAALDAGANRLLLAIGGSGSTDGGVGMLRELGGLFTDRGGDEIGDGGGALVDLVSVNFTRLRSLPPGGVIVLSDVTSPLVGPAGAAHVFGPQKGASQDEVELLDRALSRLAGHLDVPSGVPGAGAAGGTGYGLLAWGATLTGGAQGVAEAIGLPRVAAGADLVVTGEGRFDGQSEYGKVPTYVRELADNLGLPTCLIAGGIDAPTAPFAAALSLTDLAGSSQASMAAPTRYCREAGQALARLPWSAEDPSRC